MSRRKRIAIRGCHPTCPSHHQLISSGSPRGVQPSATRWLRYPAVAIPAENLVPLIPIVVLGVAKTDCQARQTGAGSQRGGADDARTASQCVVPGTHAPSPTRGRAGPGQNQNRGSEAVGGSIVPSLYTAPQRCKTPVIADYDRRTAESHGGSPATPEAKICEVVQSEVVQKEGKNDLASGPRYAESRCACAVIRSRALRIIYEKSG
jgi:hypothetical protein